MYYHARDNEWRAQLGRSWNQKHLGTYKTQAEASSRVDHFFAWLTLGGYIERDLKRETKSDIIDKYMIETAEVIE